MTKAKIATTIAAGASLLALVIPSAAALGADSYCSQKGCTQSQSQTQCAGHGAFGAFGKDNNFAGGANGQLTGFYNSELCGNPQGNP